MARKWSHNQRRFTDQQWLEDLYFMVNSMKHIHPNLFHAVPEGTFQNEVASLTEAIPDLTDHEVIVGLLKLTALTRDWHTQIISRNLTERWFPVRIEQLRDGLFIVATSPEYAQYMGSSVIRIGNFSAEAAFDRIQTATAHDNLYSQRYFASMLLCMPSILNGLHIIDDINELKLEIQPSVRDQMEVNISAEEFESDDDLSWFWQKEAAPAKECVTVALSTGSLPLYWKHTNRYYWFEFLESCKAVYLGFNMTLNEETESFSAFNIRLWDLVDRQAVDRLVVDLRHNIGGDNDILPPLFEGILEHDRINRPGGLFVLIGPKNVSASSHCAAWFEKMTPATFVGEPTGARPNQYADPEHLRLPNSQLRLMVSKRYWLNDSTHIERQWIEPHILARFNSTDYFNLRDPAMEKVIDFFK